MGPCPHRFQRLLKGIYRYCAHDYQKRLRELGSQVSMSGKGNCYDNAAIETFFKTLKAELIWRQAWQTRSQVTQALF